MSKKKAAPDQQYGIMLGDNLSFAAAEAYKLLRTNLTFALTDDQDGCRVVGVTSSVRGEGKSTTTLNLAYTIAESGKQVLVIEADMRLPTLAKRLNLKGDKGISNLLVGMNNGSEVLQTTSLHPNLYVIVAGEVPPNPSELLGSERMKVTIDLLCKSFDYILLDLPPVNAVSDPLVVSKLVAIFRLANSLDKSQRQKLSDIKVRMEHNRLLVTGETNEDMHLEQWAFSQCCPFFKEVFGIDPELTIRLPMI